MDKEHYIKKYREVFDSAPGTINPQSLVIAIIMMEKTSGGHGYLTDLKLHSSNACSAVLESKENPDVYQYFCNRAIVNKICTMMQTILVSPEIRMNIVLRSGFGPNKVTHLDTNILYNIFDYISPFRHCIPDDHIVVWGRISTLNSMPMEERGVFVSLNLPKLLWDIGKALYGLHSHNIVHNDCVIDNIGIHNGNFTLFDFDGSQPPTIDKELSTDIVRLFDSIKFYLPDVRLPRSTGKNLAVETLVWYADKELNKDYPAALTALQEMGLYYD
jgi:hypothetical protein